MSYSPKTIAHVRSTPRSSLGGNLGRAAVRRGISVIQVARATGATRQSVYNWFRGGSVLTPYRPRVVTLLEILKTSNTAEEAWKKSCKAFNLPD